MVVQIIVCLGFPCPEIPKSLLTQVSGVVNLKAGEIPGKKSGLHVVVPEEAVSSVQQAPPTGQHWVTDGWLWDSVKAARWLDEGPYLLSLSFPSSSSASKKRQILPPSNNDLKKQKVASSVSEISTDDYVPLPNWTTKVCGVSVPSIGLGVMPLCISYPKPRMERTAAIQVLHTALQVKTEDARRSNSDSSSR